MSVVSASIPTRNSARLAVRALALGTEVTPVESEDGLTYVDVTGTAEKAFLTLLGSGATVHEVTHYTESKDPKDAPGHNGEGIPNHGESAYDKTTRLMGRPKF